jgi:hypothetical protein
VDVKVVLIDRHPLAREIEGDAALRPAALLPLERPLFLLGDAEEDNPLAAGEAGPVGVGNRVFVLPGFEFHHGDAIPGNEVMDHRGEPLAHRREQRRRRNRMAKMIAQEVAESARRLQLRGIGV